jgi:hypothetical protein
VNREEPLYRRVNTRARGVRHGGGDYRWSRNGKAERADDRGHGSMHAGQRRGLDYTPLFRFLLARVGADWNDVHGEAVRRLDRAEPIFWLVARSDAERRPYVLLGENTYYSGLCVDDDGRLAKVDPALTVAAMEPSCACCTHTFNGERFTRPFVAR